MRNERNKSLPFLRSFLNRSRGTSTEIDRLDAQAWAATRIRELAERILENNRLDADSILVRREANGTISAISQIDLVGADGLRTWIQYLTVAPDNAFEIGKTDPHATRPSESLDIEMNPFTINDLELVSMVMQQMRVASR